MARFNVEDSIWTDPRFTTLAKKIGEVKATGALILLWRTGQKYWKEDRSLIPEKIYKILDHSKDLLEAGLVEKKDEGFYCIGAKDHWDWLIRRIQSAKKAGLASAAKRTNDINNLPSTSGQRESTSSNPLTLTPTLPLTLTQKNNTILPNSHWASELEKIYEMYPRKEGKKRGFAKLKNQLKDQKSIDLFARAARRYREHLIKNKTETKYIKQFSTFAGEWTDWLDDNAGQTNLTDSKTGDLLRAISEREAYD